MQVLAQVLVLAQVQVLAQVMVLAHVQVLVRWGWGPYCHLGGEQ